MAIKTKRLVGFFLGAIFLFIADCKLEPKRLQTAALEQLVFPGGILSASTGTGTPTGTEAPPVYSISVSSPALGYTLKNGTTDTLTVSLSNQPTAAVTIPVSISNVTLASVSTSSLSFTTANWNIPQTITVTGIDDLSYGV